MANIASRADLALADRRDIAPTKMIELIASTVLTSSASPSPAGVGEFREESA